MTPKDVARKQQLPNKRWAQDAACAAEPVATFVDVATLPEALAFCGRCPVITQCRNWKLSTEHGTSARSSAVWGGLTGRQRRHLESNPDAEFPPLPTSTPLAPPAIAEIFDVPVELVTAGVNTPPVEVEFGERSPTGCVAIGCGKESMSPEIGHRKRGEIPCEASLEGRRAYQRNKRAKVRAEREADLPPMDVVQPNVGLVSRETVRAAALSPTDLMSQVFADADAASAAADKELARMLGRSEPQTPLERAVAELTAHLEAAVSHLPENVAPPVVERPRVQVRWLIPRQEQEPGWAIEYAVKWGEGPDDLYPVRADFAEFAADCGKTIVGRAVGEWRVLGGGEV